MNAAPPGRRLRSRGLARPRVIRAAAWVVVAAGVAAPLVRRRARLKPPVVAVVSYAAPVALWEFSLGVYLVVKGFRPSPITAPPAAADAPAAYAGTTV